MEPAYGTEKVAHAADKLVWKNYTKRL